MPPVPGELKISFTNPHLMKKFLFTLALGLGLLAAGSASAQTPASKPTGQPAATPAKSHAMAQPRDAKGHFVKAEAAKPAAASQVSSTAPAAKATNDRPRDAKGRFVKRSEGSKATPVQPRDEKGRFVKKQAPPAPATK